MDKSNNGELRTMNPIVEKNASLSHLDLPPRIVNILTKEGILEIGELRNQMEADPGAILSIGGIGQQSMVSIKNALDSIEVEPVEDQEEVALLENEPELKDKGKKKKQKAKKEVQAKKVMAKDEKAGKKKAKNKDAKEKNKKVEAKAKDKSKQKVKKAAKKKDTKKSNKKDTKRKAAKKKDNKKKDAKKKKGKKKK